MNNNVETKTESFDSKPGSPFIIQFCFYTQHTQCPYKKLEIVIVTAIRRFSVCTVLSFSKRQKNPFYMALKYVSSSVVLLILIRWVDTVFSRP